MNPNEAVRQWTEESDEGRRLELADTYNAWNGYPAFATLLADGTLVGIERLSLDYAMVGLDNGHQWIHRNLLGRIGALSELLKNP